MRFSIVPCGLLIAAAASSCTRNEVDEGQRLSASVEVLASDGSTPLADAAVDAYVVYFEVGDGIEIERRFDEDVTAAPGIRTDELGLFEIQAADLSLSYDWEQDEYVCEDVCLEWETVCEPVTEEVCVEQCEVVTYEDCWDECWDECTTTCYDEVYCDEDGYCWTETVCQDDCTTVCEPVCGPVTAEDCWLDCWDETHEECNDVCLEIVEECGWVTRTYTSYPALSEVVSTRSELRLRDESGQEHVVAGETLRSEQAQRCDGQACEPLDVGLQQDRFVVPFGP